MMRKAVMTLLLVLVGCVSAVDDGAECAEGDTEGQCAPEVVDVDDVTVEEAGTLRANNCGDGVCLGRESCKNCSEDCGACQEKCGADTCSEAQICCGSKCGCVPAWLGCAGSCQL